VNPIMLALLLLSLVLCFILVNGLLKVALSPYGPIELNPSFYDNQDKEQAFVDIQIGDDLVDWQPFRLEFAKFPLVSLPFHQAKAVTIIRT
jgi:hypothetical protein